MYTTKYLHKVHTFIILNQRIHRSQIRTVGTTVMKNCEPLEFGPAFAMLSVYGRSCLRFG